MVTFVDSHGLALYVRDEPGTEPATPTLVFLHSLGTESRIWDGVIARLGAFRRIALDLRGHGLSEVPDGPYSIAAMAEDIAGALHALGVERAVLIGVSVGGQIALRMALDRPSLVVAVVAMDSAGKIGDQEAWEARREAVRGGGLAAIADSVVARWLSTASAERHGLQLRGLRQLLLRTPVAGYLGTCAALRDEDLRPHLADLKVPLLAVCGSEDVPTPPSLVRDLADSVPDGRYAEIEGAAHLPCLDRPAETARLVDRFARRCSR
jgi:3-oxoadipate enol-lactonase